MTINNRLNKTEGIIPPQALDVEKAVIGALMLEPDAIVTIGSVLRPEMFYVENHKIIYQSIFKMNDNGDSIDMVTVPEHLKKIGKLDEVGGYYYITELVQKVASAANIEFHAQIIKEKYIKRELINIATLVNNKAYNDGLSSDEVLSFINKKLESLYVGDEENDTVLLSKAIDDVCDDIKENQGEGKKVEGFSTDMQCLRDKIPVWENGRLIVLAARPGMGKTALGIHEALNATKQGKPTLFFTLEMSFKQMAQRILLREDSLNRSTFKINNVDDRQWECLDNAITETYDEKLYISDKTYSLTGIINKSKIFKKKHDIGCVIIDYLQLIEGDKGLVREQQVAQISRSCKMLSKELEIPVFLLAQLNRESEKRNSEGFIPKMSDLRESGAIEQDADIIIFPHRACYYEPEDERAWIVVAKNRDGETGNAEVRTNKNVTKFYDPNHTEFKNFEKTTFGDAPFEQDKPF